MKYLKKFENHSQYESYIATDYAKPNVSICVQENHVHYNPIPHDYSEDYLTFVAKESGTFTFTPSNSNVISYSTDNGETWTEGNSVAVNSGDKVMWKGTMTPASYQGVGKFSSTANFDAQGNAMSLLFGDNYKGQTDFTGKNYAFYSLFYANTKVINAENLSLPAETLANYCYSAMFYNCTSLTTAPELPAQTLIDDCYNGMFYGCTSLTTAPELLAITLAERCYGYMFNGCTSLNYIKAMFTTEPSSTYTDNWVNGVSATGTFVKNSAAQWDITGSYAVPTGWTVQTASE